MKLPWTLAEIFPECSEYLVRADWMENGEHIWVQLLDRTQKLLKVVIISVESFVSEGSRALSPLPYVLLEESTDVWINVSYCSVLQGLQSLVVGMFSRFCMTLYLLQVTDILKFLPTRVSDVSLEFLWCSERSGYRHLYLITAKPPEKSLNLVLKAECSVQQLTAGCWTVFGSEVLEFHVVLYTLCGSLYLGLGGCTTSRCIF